MLDVDEVQLTSQTMLSIHYGVKTENEDRSGEKNLDHFSICACHPCAGAMLIFSVSFQFYQMSPKGQTLKPFSEDIYILMYLMCLSMWDL